MMKGKQQVSLKKKQAPQKGKQNPLVQRTTAAAAYGSQVRTGAPKVDGNAWTGDGSCIVTHREYLGEVLGSVNFSVTKYPINPGLVKTFPWLAENPAPGYESYLADTMRFCFESQKSASTDGSVMLGVDYDTADDDPVNKTQLMAYHGAVRANVWDHVTLNCDSQDLKKFGVQRYIRLGDLSTNQDIKTYDVGNFFIATQGCANATAIGELYVEYKIKLHTPQLNSTARFLASSRRISTTAASRAAPFTGTQTVTGGLSVTASGATLTFNRVGQYIINIQTTGTVQTNVNPTLTGTSTVTNYGAGQYTIAGALLADIDIVVQVNNIGETLIFDFTASATTLTESYVRIGSYAYSLG